MKNLLLQVTLASTLVLGALSIVSTTASAQSAGARGGGANNGAGHAFAINPSRLTRYSRDQKNTCECTVRRSSQNGSAATYKVCKKRVELLDGSYVNRTCQPSG